MKKAIILFIIILTAKYNYSQTGGLSASKLATLCTETVSQNSIEFEPSFSFNRNCYADTEKICSSMMFRFTYGLYKNLEVGVSVKENISMANWGLKYNFFSNKNISFAYIVGVNTPLENKIIDDNNKSTNNSIATGFILSKQLNKKLSFDTDIQYQKHLF